MLSGSLHRVHTATGRGMRTTSVDACIPECSVFHLKVFRCQAAIDPSLRWNTLHPGIQASTRVVCMSLCLPNDQPAIGQHIPDSRIRNLMATYARKQNIHVGNELTSRRRGFKAPGSEERLDCKNKPSARYCVTQRKRASYFASTKMCIISCMHNAE